MPESIKLEIVLNSEGGIAVHGPIHDRILCFGMLEVAKMSLQEHATKLQQDRRIEPVTGLEAIQLVGR